MVRPLASVTSLSICRTTASFVTQNWQEIIPALLSFAFLCSSFWLFPLFNALSLTRCTAFSSFKTLSCTELISDAWQITIQPSKVSSASLSSQALSMLSFISQTVQSLINLSFKSQNSHLAALLRKSVTYESIRSPHQVNSLKRMYVFQQLSSFSDYSTIQTSPLFYPLYSHHRHCPTETCLIFQGFWSHHM